MSSNIYTQAYKAVNTLNGLQSSHFQYDIRETAGGLVSILLTSPSHSARVSLTPEEASNSLLVSEKLSVLVKSLVQ